MSSTGTISSLSAHAGDGAALMPVVITTILMSAALWVILSRKYSPNEKHWAFGIIGTIVGFWLHN